MKKRIANLLRRIAYRLDGKSGFRTRRQENVKIEFKTGEIILPKGEVTPEDRANDFVKEVMARPENNVPMKNDEEIAKELVDKFIPKIKS